MTVRRFAQWCGYVAIVVIFLFSSSHAQAAEKDSTGEIFVVLVLASYFLPAIVASIRRHRNQDAIFVVNLFFGWTLVGWVVALAWSATADIKEREKTLKKQRKAEQREAPAQELVENDRVFRPDGMAEAIPYRVLPNGETEAMIQGGIVRFHSLDQLWSMMNLKGLAEDKSSESKQEPNLDFREEVDGVPYILNRDSTVTAKTPIGVRTYGSWAAFRWATRKKSWE